MTVRVGHPSTWTEQFIAQYVHAEWKIKNLELLTAQHSATLVTHCNDLQQCACAFFVLERLGLQFAPTELARAIHTPTVGDMEALKRVARCLIGHGRLIQELARRVKEPSHVVAFTDSNHASCLRAHTSTSSSTTVLWFPHATLNRHGAFLMLEDVVVDISEHSKLGQVVLEVGIDASTPRAWQHAEELRESGTLQRQLCGFTSPLKTAKSKSQKKNTWCLKHSRSWNQTP